MDEKCEYPGCGRPASVELVRVHFGGEYDDEYIALCGEHAPLFVDEGATVVE